MTSLGRSTYTSRTGVTRPPPLPRRRHWRFIRRANDYLRAYAYFDKGYPTPRVLHEAAAATNDSLFNFIEKTRRVFKSHRCAGEQEFSFTTRDDEGDQVIGDDDVNCERYLIENYLNNQPNISMDDQVDAFLQL